MCFLSALLGGAHFLNVIRYYQIRKPYVVIDVILKIAIGFSVFYS